jgi:hypothetical protein
MPCEAEDGIGRSPSRFGVADGKRHAQNRVYCSTIDLGQLKENASQF